MIANYLAFFPGLPERTRLQRLLRDHAEDVLPFLAEPSFFTVLDTYGIELIHSRREGRSKQQIGRKGKSNGRWIVGIKLAWLINDDGEVVDWTWERANEPDNVFRPLATGYDGETIALADLGLREKDAPRSNIHCCERGTWNERFTIETNLSWVTELFHAKKIYHRVKSHLEARLWYLAALIIMVMIAATGHLSGAHFNPAVTLAFTLTRHFPWCDVPLYIGAQLLGATAGAFTIQVLFGPIAHLGATFPSGSLLQSLGLEILLTAVLMFVIISVATDTRAVGQLAALAIGGTVALDALWGGPISGASMNPARSFGPALLAGAWQDHWVYWIGPVLGAIIGAFAYQVVRTPLPQEALIEHTTPLL